MALVYQNIMDLARIPLNDEDKVRYSDAMLMSFTVHGMLQVLKRRPDLFIGRFDTPPGAEEGPAGIFPLQPEYAQLIADYVTARAEAGDDEHLDSGRAAVFMQLFSSEAQP